MASKIEQQNCPAPAAWQQPAILTEHGHMRQDEYRWMHDLKSPRMREFLRANNEHAERVMAPLRGLRDRLFEELKAWLPPDEGSAGYVSGNYWYRTRFERGRDYPVFVRRCVAPPGPEEVLLDENELARGCPLFVCDGAQVSPRHDRLAFAVDTTGDCAYTLRFKNLATGEFYPETIPDADAHCVWANDNRTLFYTRLERGTYCPSRIYRHVLGEDPARDILVYEERDDTFRCLLLPTRTRRFVLLNAYSNNAEEILFLDANRPEDAFRVFCPRRTGHQYEVGDDGERFIIRTNWQAPDFRICEAPAQPESNPDDWLEILAGRPGRFLEHMAVFRDYIALTGFRGGLQKLFVLDRRGGELHEAALPEEVCHVWLEENPSVAAPRVRIGFTSLKTPVAFYDYDMPARALSLVRREEVPGYRPEEYVTECRWAAAPDGERVPISLVYRRDTPASGPAPLFLFGYGEYGTNIPVYFDQSRLALLDRGFIYAMAHVRGGTELGSRWHADGRRLRKRNTFTDFIACAEYLVQAGLADRGQLYAESLSSGGLLLGATVNMRPDLFRGVYACKPFVDLLSAMLDPNLPLTSFEYDELGNPRRRDEYEYMRAYSPYDNIVRQACPHMLITAAVHDSQVPCWEPAKWAARLRAHNPAATQVILKTDLAAGHAGLSGRVERMRELAFLYAFLLDLAGKG